MRRSGRCRRWTGAGCQWGYGTKPGQHICCGARQTTKAAVLRQCWTHSWRHARYRKTPQRHDGCAVIAGFLADRARRPRGASGQEVRGGGACDHSPLDKGLARTDSALDGTNVQAGVGKRRERDGPVTDSGAWVVGVWVMHVYGAGPGTLRFMRNGYLQVVGPGFDDTANYRHKEPQLVKGGSDSEESS